MCKGTGVLHRAKHLQDPLVISSCEVLPKPQILRVSVSCLGSRAEAWSLWLLELHGGRGEWTRPKAAWVKAMGRRWGQQATEAHSRETRCREPAGLGGPPECCGSSGQGLALRGIVQLHGCSGKIRTWFPGVCGPNSAHSRRVAVSWVSGRKTAHRPHPAPPGS